MRDTIDMAREAGFGEDTSVIWAYDREGVCTDELKAFEALVRADEREEGQRWFDAVTAQHKQELLAEREACAKVCESIDDYDENVDAYYSDIYAAAIRARGQA